MNTTNALEAALVFLGVVAAVRALAFVRIRAASRTKDLVHDVTKLVALGLVLAAAPVMRATAADVTSAAAGDAAFAGAHDDTPYSADDPAEATARAFPDILTSDAHDDAGLAPEATSDEPGSGATAQDTRVAATPSYDPDPAAFDDCSCS